MSGGGAGLDSTSDANGPPQASRVDHAAITAPSRRRSQGMNRITASIQQTTANPGPRSTRWQLSVSRRTRSRASPVVPAQVIPLFCS